MVRANDAHDGQPLRPDRAPEGDRPDRLGTSMAQCGGEMEGFRHWTAEQTPFCSWIARASTFFIDRHLSQRVEFQSMK